jgi:hypothetical protein
MKKVALALLVLAITMPAMAEVRITLSVGEPNEVIVGYETDGEDVRAFALSISVSGGAYIVGSAEPTQDPETGDYWVYPTNMTFTVSDGNTVVDEYGSPIAEESNDGGVLEMASLYSANDPCHPAKPPTSGTLCSFRLANECGGEPNFTVTVTENAQRAGIVLEDPDEAVTDNLPQEIVVPCYDVYPCVLVVGETIGGVVITQAMKDLHESMGNPECWCYDCHFRGDVDGNGLINVSDVAGSDGPGGTILDGWVDAWNTAYTVLTACADINNDGLINVSDVAGSDGPGGTVIDGWVDGWNNGCPP